MIEIARLYDLGTADCSEPDVSSIEPPRVADVIACCAQSGPNYRNKRGAQASQICFAQTPPASERRSNGLGQKGGGGRWKRVSGSCVGSPQNEAKCLEWLVGAIVCSVRGDVSAANRGCHGRLQRTTAQRNRWDVRNHRGTRAVRLAATAVLQLPFAARHFRRRRLQADRGKRRAHKCAARSATMLPTSDASGFSLAG